MDFCASNDPFYRLMKLYKCCIIRLQGLPSKMTFSTASGVPEENNVSVWPHTVFEKNRISYCSAIFDIFLRL